MKLNCAGWKQTSCDDGPGVRSVFFFQGCSRNCPGCQNSCTHSKANGTVMNVEDAFNFIKKNCRNKKITISGGEPLEQKNALVELLDLLNGDGFNICVYTGWNLEKVSDDVIGKINYLKCGHFDASKMSSNLMYVGSTNQKMYKIASGKLIEMNLFYEEKISA